jgi:predicted HD phosphohydrolase
MTQTPFDTRATFATLEEATTEDWQVILSAEAADRARYTTGDRLSSMLSRMRDDPPLGSPINMYQHSLQTATRVLRAQEDDELVIVALFHDLAEALSDNHHGLVMAQLLSPWLSERRTWLLVHHADFQRIHFINHPAPDANARDRYEGHPCFAETAHFCKAYDQNSFDASYPTLALDDFLPIVRRFFARPRPPLQPLSSEGSPSR